MKRVLLTILAIAAVASIGAPAASAFWTDTGSGSGSATTATMSDGPTPTGLVSGSTVTVSVDQVQFLGFDLGSLAGGGYEIRRYPASGGGAITPGGSCAALLDGVAATLSCTETSVPLGHWRYTTTPILNSWTGAESTVSAVQTVAPDAPASASSSLLPAAGIALSWSAVPGVSGYNVYRRTDIGSYNFSAPLNGGTPIVGTSFNDTSSVSGTSYNYVVRAVFVDGTQIESANSPETTVLTADGSLPTGVSIVDPGTPIRGTVNLTGAASDTISGLATVEFQHKPSAGSSWVTVCTDNASPWTCSFDTSAVSDGDHDFRIVATDLAGNATTSSAAGNRLVDNTAPTGATFTAPPALISGTIAIDAGTPTDTGSGMQSVAIERSPAGADTWTTICTDTTPAYSCSFDSTAATDGLYDFRAAATDNAGNVAHSTTSTNHRVDNTAPSAIADNPGLWIRGTATLGGSGSDAGSGLASLVLEGRLVGEPTWAPLQTNTGPTVSISYDTTTLPDDDYEIRVTATDNAGLVSTATVTPINVDNTVPTAATTDPGANLVGTVAVDATGTDAYSGVADVQMQRSPAGAGTWTTICTDTTSAYSCSWNTTGVTDGLYDLRSITTDVAGNTATSAVVTNRRVDNTAPTATLGAIANPIRATLNMTATSTDGGSGVANVQFQRSPAGGGSWTTICTDATSAYTCAFNTTGVGDGLYDFRSLATDNAGNTTASTLQTSIRVDNTVPTATDIQTVNSGISGRATTGDQVIYTFSEAMQPASILAGWTGASTNVTVRLNNVGGGDRLLVYNAANSAATNLGTVNTGNNGYVTANRTFTTSTMVMSGNVVTVTLGTPSGGTNTVAGNATLTWTPLAAMLDLAGNAMSTTARTETGAADRNF